MTALVSRVNTARLELASGSGGLLPGAFTFRTGNIPTRWRCEAGTLRPATTDSPALLLMRLRPHPSASQQFRLLNDRIAQLHRENQKRTWSGRLVEEQREWLHTLLSIGDGVIATDVQARVLFMNPVAEELTGWTSNQPTRIGDLTRVTESHRAKAAAAAGLPEREMHRALRDGKASDERWHRRKDGSRFWAMGIMLPLRDAQGEVRGFRIEGYAKVLLDEFRADLPPPAQEYLRRIGASTTRLDKLIQDVLSYSRLDRARVGLHPVPLEPVIRDILHEHSAFQSPHSEIIVEVPVLPVTADGTTMGSPGRP